MLRKFLLSLDPAEGGNPSHEAIEKARLEERAKVQEDIKARDALLKEAQDSLTATSAEKAALEKSLKDAQDKLAALTEASTEGGKLDVEKLIAGVQFKVSSEYQKTLGAKVEELQKANESYRLRELRAQLITEAGGPDAVVMEAITGSTEAELRSSVAIAKQAMTRIRENVLRTATGGGTPNGSGSNTSGANGQGSTGQTSPNPGSGASGGDGTGSAGDGELTAEQIRALPPAEFAKHRDKLKAKLRQRYLPGNALVR